VLSYPTRCQPALSLPAPHCCAKAHETRTEEKQRRWFGDNSRRPNNNDVLRTRNIIGSPRLARQGIFVPQVDVAVNPGREDYPSEVTVAHKEPVPNVCH